MTRRCLDTGDPFGVVLIRDGRVDGGFDPRREGVVMGD